jgi:WD40 repeat protein
MRFLCIFVFLAVWLAAQETKKPAVAQFPSRVALKPQIFAMAKAPDAKLLALAGYKTVRLVDAKGTEIAILDGHQETVRSVAISADGRLLAAGGGMPARKGEVKLWNLETKQVAATIVGHSDCIYAVAFSPDGKLLATSSYDKLIKLWDTTTGQEVRTLKDHIDAIYALQFSADGTRLVSGGADRTVKIWNPATGERLFTLSDATDGINSVALSPDGKRVAAAGLDKSIRIWSLGEKSGALEQSLIAHEDAIIKIAWSPDGKQIVSASADRTVRIFDAAQLVEIRSIPNQPDWTYGIEFLPTGFVVGRYDGSLSVYGSDLLSASAKTAR